MKYKYTLIISQYYHSRHMFIVQHTEDFIERAKKFAYELMEYKRDEDYKRELRAGDLDYIKDSEVRQRYNINDSGDIYLIQSNYVNYLMNVANEYHETTVLESRERGSKSKRVMNEIAEHHQYTLVKEIVEKYFEII